MALKSDAGRTDTFAYDQTHTLCLYNCQIVRKKGNKWTERVRKRATVSALQEP